MTPSIDTEKTYTGGMSKIVRIGILLIIAGIGGRAIVERTPWYHERVLKNLTLEELSLAIHDWPNDASAFMHFGSALLTASQLPGAEGAFTRAAALAPKNADAHKGLGSALLRQGKLLKAKNAFEEAIKHNDKDVESYLGLSQAYYLAGSSHSAIPPLVKITELDPKNANAWYQLGKFYGDDHQSDLAYAALKKAVAIDPGKDAYWRDLSQVAKHYSRLDEAETDLKSALKINDKDQISYFWLGQIYAQMPDSPRSRGSAEASLSEAIARDPNMAPAHFELGQLYERRSLWEMASTCYRRATKIDASDDKSLYRLAICLDKLGQKAEAQTLMRGAKELASVKQEIENLQNRIVADPSNRELRLRLARTFAKYGNESGAISQYNLYETSGPVLPNVSMEINAFKSKVASENRQAQEKRQGDTNLK